MKQCSKCCIEKSLTEFYPQKHGRHGVASVCKSCSAEYHKNAPCRKCQDTPPDLPVVPGFEFRKCPGYSCYCVDDQGGIWSCRIQTGGSLRKIYRKTWKKRKACPDTGGYLCLGLVADDGSKSTRLVHQLVLEAFVGPAPAGMEACHFPDRNKINNSLRNLRWGTRSDNQKDAVIHGTNLCSVKGERHMSAKLTDAQVRMVFREAHIRSQRSVADSFGISKTQVANIFHMRSRSEALK